MNRLIPTGLAACAIVLAAQAEAQADTACAAILGDRAIIGNPDHPRHRAMVTCQLAEMAASQAETAAQETGRAAFCNAAVALATRLDLSSFASSLAPRLNGATHAPDLGPVTIGEGCGFVEIGDPNWTFRMNIYALDADAVTVFLQDFSPDGGYDAPAALRIPLAPEGALRAEEYCDQADRPGCD